MTRSIQNAHEMSHKEHRDALTKFQVTLGNQCTSDAGIAIGTTKTKVKTTAIADVIIDGVHAPKAATDNLWTPSGTVATGTVNVFYLLLDVSGTATTVMGTAGATLAAVIPPAVTAGTAVVGILRIAPTGTGSFVGGTTELDDATVVPVAVYQDIRGPFNGGEQTL